MIIFHIQGEREGGTKERNGESNKYEEKFIKNRHTQEGSGGEGQTTSFAGNLIENTKKFKANAILKT